MSNKRSNRGELGEPVAPTVALQHAVLAVRRAWAGGVPDFAEWGSANVDPEPLIINDLNGERLFYDFNVSLDSRAIGVVRAAAAADIPATVSFTAETDGRLRTVQPLYEAIEQVDAVTAPGPPTSWCTVRIRGISGHCSTTMEPGGTGWWGFA